jgi:putative SOS response-associated peptidase YedK
VVKLPKNIAVGSKKLLETACVKELKRYPVSRLVNRVENNSNACIEPLKARE